MTFHEATIAIRLWVWAAVLRPLKRLVPLESLVRLAHRSAVRQQRSETFERLLEHYMDRSGRFPFRPPANCLERSLGAYRMLCAANAAPEIVVGVRRSPGRGVEGHVWVTVDGRPLAESAERLATYTAVARFDTSAQRHAGRTPGDSLAGITLR